MSINETEHKAYGSKNNSCCSKCVQDNHQRQQWIFFNDNGCAILGCAIGPKCYVLKADVFLYIVEGNITNILDNETCMCTYT